MKRFLAIILAVSFIFVAWFGLGNVDFNFHADGHTCSQTTLTGEACPVNQDLLGLLNWFFPAAAVSLAEILLVALVAWVYVIIKPPFYRHRFRRWLSLLERRADCYSLLTA